MKQISAKWRYWREICAAKRAGQNTTIGFF
jgi:hypothetical protein